MLKKNKKMKILKLLIFEISQKYETYKKRIKKSIILIINISFLKSNKKTKILK
jgi:hypothetical protein